MHCKALYKHEFMNIDNTAPLSLINIIIPNSVTWKPRHKVQAHSDSVAILKLEPSNPNLHSSV